MMIVKKGKKIKGWEIAEEIEGMKISNIRDIKIDQHYRIDRIMIRGKIKIPGIGEQQIQGLIQGRLGIGERIIIINIKKVKIWG
jgi:hypothetical protein